MVTACGGGDQDPVEQTNIEATPPAPLAINSEGGCGIDSDCAAGSYCFLNRCATACQADADCPDGLQCTKRGRCLEASQTQMRTQKSALSDRLDGINVDKLPETTFRVDADQKTITFELQLNQEAPVDRIPYRIDRSDDETVSNKVEYTDGRTRTLSFEVPVGRADPSADESTLVLLKLFTPVGEYEIRMVPNYSVAGQYAGNATIEMFGTTGLNLEMEVVTEPTGASLQDADKAWLVLPAGPRHLFSPTRSSDSSPEYVARRLERDEFVDRWVATFEGRFDLADGKVVASDDADQVKRSLRFELEQLDADTLIGSFNDRWSGIYETRSVQGVEQLEDVIFNGEIEVKRLGEARSHEELEVIELPEAKPEKLPAPSIQGCAETMALGVDPVTVDEQTTYSCDGIETVEQFDQAPPADQASCGLAVAESALAGDTTIAKVEAYLNGEEGDTGGKSFAEFMKQCAAHTDGLCEPTDKLLCGRDLVAHAYDRQGSDSTDLEQLVDAYQSTTREAFFGQQVAAFSADTSIRLDWLKSTNWPPTFQGLKDLVGSMLEDWKTNVLQAHLGSLRGQFDRSGLAVLSRQLADPDAAEAREQLLVGMTQSWRGAIDALTLVSKRWNVLYQSADKRAQKSAFVSARLFDLYLSAGILRNLNTAAGAGYLSARLAGGLDVLVDELGRLSNSFSNLVYARDGEVIVNTSLDPESSNQSLLGERRRAAIAEIEEAQDEVSSVLEEARAEALNREQLENRMANRIDDTRAKLLQMCGRPVGCEDVNYLEGQPPEDCRIRTQAGACGFKVDRQSGDVLAFDAGRQNTSEAGRVLLTGIEAAQNITIADSERQSLVERIDLRWRELNAFKRSIDQRYARRTRFIEDLRTNVANRAELRNQKVKEVMAKMEEQAALHDKKITESKKRFEKWDAISSKGTQERMGMMVEAERQRTAARVSQVAASRATGTAGVLVQGMPTSAGPSTDPTVGARMLTLALGEAIANGLQLQAVGLNSSAAQLDIERQRQANRENSRLSGLKDDFKIDKAKWSAQLAELRRESKREEMLTDAQIAQLKDAITIAEEYLQAQLAHERNLAKFRQKRTRIMEMLTKIQGMNLRVEQAKLQLKQVMARYQGVVQRARLTDSKLGTLVEQRTNINSLIGSPGVIFSQANELEAAEEALFNAKRKLMDWLVALEYYAVRPFIDQRMQILLARNTYQLEQIAEELNQLENKCGGATSQISTVLSVREDLLGIDQPITDAVTDQTLSADDRFRELLNRGHVPVDKRVRYSTDDTIGSLMGRDPNIMSGTFYIDLTDFANLELSCNAKVKSVAVNLVGKGLSDIRPTVTMLYDGTSKLRSCQPGIAEYVDLVGSTATTYGEISRFHTEGRSMSPVASVNGFGEMGGQKSNTLSGLPLASQYTLLINKTAGENEAIDWSKLDDIELKLNYSYQDVFPKGQCEL